MVRSSLMRKAWLPALLLVGCGLRGPGAEEELTLEVAPQTVACSGEAPQRCLLVRRPGEDEWTRFYDPIAGFTHEEGFRYTIVVLRRRLEATPADASSFEYRLLRILSKEPAG